MLSSTLNKRYKNLCFVWWYKLLLFKSISMLVVQSLCKSTPHGGGTTQKKLLSKAIPVLEVQAVLSKSTPYAGGKKSCFLI